MVNENLASQEGHGRLKVFSNELSYSKFKYKFKFPTADAILVIYECPGNIFVLQQMISSIKEKRRVLSGNDNWKDLLDPRH